MVGMAVTVGMAAMVSERRMGEMEVGEALVAKVALV